MFRVLSTCSTCRAPHRQPPQILEMEECTTCALYAFQLTNCDPFSLATSTASQCDTQHIARYAIARPVYVDERQCPLQTRLHRQHDFTENINVRLTKRRCRQPAHPQSILRTCVHCQPQPYGFRLTPSSRGTCISPPTIIHRAVNTDVASNQRFQMRAAPCAALSKQSQVTLWDTEGPK